LGGIGIAIPGMTNPLDKKLTKQQNSYFMPRVYSACQTCHKKFMNELRKNKKAK
jgi:thioredoxin reductase